MQKPFSPITFSSPSPSPAPARTRQAEVDSGQFNQALTREIEQRRPAAPAAPEQPRKEAVKEVARADKAAAQKQAGAEQVRKQHGKEAAKDAKEAAKDAQDAAEATPMAEMLALVASFNLPQQAAAQAAVAETAPVAVAGKAMDAQLAALQSAFAKLAPVGEEQAAPVPMATDGTFPAMLGKLDAPADELPASTAERPEPMLKAEPQARTAAASEVTVARPALDISQIVRRAPEASAGEAPVSGPLAAAVQQASLAVTQAANAVAGDKIAARVGTTAWDSQVAQKIIYMVGGEEMSASLTLNPPDLGPMQVVLNVNNDHTDVMFSSAQPEVRQALEDALPKLREMMSESGISLGNASVDDGAQQQAQEDAARMARSGGTSATNGSAAESEAQVAARPTRVGELPGLVNTFA